MAPRDNKAMDPRTSARIKELERQLLAEKSARIAEQRRHQAEVGRLQAMNEALGKAIGRLQDLEDIQKPMDES